MKLKALLLIALYLLPALIQAQNEQLQREIRIAEGILQELFQENLDDKHPFMVFRGNQITSDYIPGYGVHFILGNNLWAGHLSPSRAVHMVRSGNNSTVVRTAGDDDQNSNGDVEEVTVEELEMKMTEYFTQYAPLLKNLPENEHIRLSTGLNSQITGFTISVGQGDRNIEFPKITKWVSMSDVMEFQSGKMSESQFTQQIKSADLSEVSEKRDFNIFQSILTTSMQEADFEQLRVRSASSYTYLPGFGIQFNINANTRGSGPLRAILSKIGEAPNIDFDVSVEVQENMERAQREARRLDIDSVRLESRRALDSLQFAVANAQVSLQTALNQELDSERLESRRILDSLQYDLEGAQISLRAAFTGDREPIDPELLESDKELLYNEIERAIIDYGNTLSSLPDDEFIIVSVNWSSRESTLPERTYIRLKKNQLPRGDALEVQEIPRSN